MNDPLRGLRNIFQGSAKWHKENFKPDFLTIGKLCKLWKSLVWDGRVCCIRIGQRLLGLIYLFQMIA